MSFYLRYMSLSLDPRISLPDFSVTFQMTNTNQLQSKIVKTSQAHQMTVRLCKPEPCARARRHEQDKGRVEPLCWLLSNKRSRYVRCNLTKCTSLVVCRYLTKKKDLPYALVLLIFLLYHTPGPCLLNVCNNCKCPLLTHVLSKWETFRDSESFRTSLLRFWDCYDIGMYG